MNRHTANERIWQFRPIYFEVAADTLVSVDPFKPKDISVFSKNGKMVVQGSYGVDIFSNHKFTLLVNGQPVVYSNIDEIPLEFDNVISFAPDDTHDITFTYTFSKHSDQFTYSHWVHHDMAIWERFLPELMKRETNGGWKYASSN